MGWGGYEISFCVRERGVDRGCLQPLSTLSNSKDTTKNYSCVCDDIYTHTHTHTISLFLLSDNTTGMTHLKKIDKGNFIILFREYG